MYVACFECLVSAPFCLIRSDDCDKGPLSSQNSLSWLTVNSKCSRRGEKWASFPNRLTWEDFLFYAAGSPSAPAWTLHVMFVSNMAARSLVANTDTSSLSYLTPRAATPCVASASVPPSLSRRSLPPPWPCVWADGTEAHVFSCTLGVHYNNMIIKKKHVAVRTTPRRRFL